MQFNGVTITGAARVTDSHIELDVELPRLARMFSSRIEREVERKDGRRTEMSEDAPNITTVNGISEFLQKNGLATMLVLAGLWFVVLPLNERYQKMLEEVSQSNTSLTETVKELKEGIVTIGRTNSEVVADNQVMLKDIERRLEDVEEASKEMVGLLRDLRGGRGQQYTLPANFTETDE